MNKEDPNPCNLSIRGLSKQYHNRWIFKDLNFNCSGSEVVSITGPNGSGKSTLIKSIAGLVFSSSGEIAIKHNGNLVPSSEHHFNIAITAPYLSLNEHLKVEELVDFHFSFKPAFQGFNKSQFLERLSLDAQRSKLYKELSSGQQQRLKLGLVMRSDVPILLLDEPTGNLDKAGIQLYNEFIEESDKLILIASNQKHEYAAASRNIRMSDLTG